MNEFDEVMDEYPEKIISVCSGYNFIAVASNQGTIRIFTINTGIQVQIFSVSGTIINIIAKNTVLAIIKQRSIDINNENL